MSGVRGEPFMLRTAFRIQPKCYRDSLEKGGLPRAVLSNEERHRCFEPQFGKMANGGHGIWISRGSGPSERTRATVWMKMPGTVGASLGRRFFISEGVPAL